MNNTFLKIIAGVFLALVVIVAFLLFSDTPTGSPTDKPSAASVDFSGFSAASVNRIVMKQGGSERVLSYRDDKWFIGEEEADKTKVEQLFKEFSTLAVKDMVSQNEENFGKFGVTKDTGLELTIVQWDKESVFLVGNDTPVAGDFYLRKSGIKNVYLMSGSARDLLIREASEWKVSEKGEK